MNNTTTEAPPPGDDAIYTHAMHYAVAGMPSGFPHWFYNLAGALRNAGGMIYSPERPHDMRIWIEGVDGSVFTEADIRRMLNNG